ncbi:MAG: hypothetical protein QG627_176 [Chlamydiota bacterium]|nr:hypothetical protein [Chlamydiota bacterium]
MLLPIKFMLNCINNAKDEEKETVSEKVMKHANLNGKTIQNFC